MYVETRISNEPGLNKTPITNKLPYEESFMFNSKDEQW